MRKKKTFVCKSFLRRCCSSPLFVCISSISLKNEFENGNLLVLVYPTIIIVCKCDTNKIVTLAQLPASGWFTLFHWSFSSCSLFPFPFTTTTPSFRKKKIMEETWSNYKTKPATASLYTEDAAVIYVPTGAGARGSAQIRRFYLQPGFSQKANTLNEQVHSKVIAGNRIIEEAEWNITFHGGECTWLAPNVDEGLLVIYFLCHLIRGHC